MRLMGVILMTAFLMCDLTDSDGDDPRVYLEPSQIRGAWLRITEETAPLPGYFYRDTVIYRIGIDSMPDVGTPYLDDPMTFHVIYDRGGDYGYIHSPRESYDWETEISVLHYTLVTGLPGPGTVSAALFFMRSPDSLCICLGDTTVMTRRQ